MEIPPPSLLLLTPLVIVYVSQTVRFANLIMATKELVGGRSLKYWTYLFFFPVVLAALNPKAFPALDQLILLTRAHFLAVIVCMLIIAEVFLRGALTNGIVRLARTVENSRDVAELQAATDALAILGLYDMAIVGFNRIAQIVPESSLTYSHLASLYGIQRRFVRAEEAAIRAITIDPNNKYGHFYLGMSAHELGRADDAAECFQKARELGLTLHAAHFPKHPSK